MLSLAAEVSATRSYSSHSPAPEGDGPLRRSLWARRGTTPRQPADQRYESADLFGAICPARGVGAGLAMPYVETGAIQAHLDVISKAVAPGAHAVLLLDRAGWHTTAPYAIHNVLTDNGIQFITVGAGSSTVLIMTRAHLILSTTNR